MAKTGKSHNYVMQRNYSYETQHDDSKYKGLTEEEWKEKILEEWSCDNLKANHVTLIFHGEDKDKDTGVDKGLHVHGVSNFVESLTQSEALKHSGCSSELNCTPMKDKALAYRYLLHVTEKAMEEKKHIYSENELIFLVADKKTFGLEEFHKIISRKKQEDEDTVDAKKLIKGVVDDIIAGKYNPQDDDDRTSIYDKIVTKDNIANAIAQYPNLYRKVMNAITIQESRNAIVVLDRKSDPKERKYFLAGIVGDEWETYRKQLGITLEECLEAQEYLQNEAAR